MDERVLKHIKPSLVIFDMDDVLAHLDRGRRLLFLSQATGKSPEHFHATIWQSDFEEGAEAGNYADGVGYLAAFNRRSGCALSRWQWIEARRQAMTLIPGTLEIARALQKTVRIATLSNNGALLRESLPQMMPEIHALFGDSFHASCEFKARKPDREVFERLMTHCGLDPSEAVMIDDDPVNVEGARRAGLQGLVFRGAEQLRGDLLEMGLQLG